MARRDASNPALLPARHWKLASLTEVAVLGAFHAFLPVPVHTRSRRRMEHCSATIGGGYLVRCMPAILLLQVGPVQPALPAAVVLLCLQHQ